MSEEYSRKKVDLKEKLYVQHLTFTTDIWTDTYTQRCFLGLSGHYICDKFNLNVAILCVKEFPAKKKRKLIL